MKHEPTGIEALVCDEIAKRQAYGLNKYGVSVAESPLPLRNWLQHGLEEALDLAVYLKRAIAQIEVEANATVGDELHAFLDAAGGDGLVLGGIDAGDLFMKLYGSEREVTLARASQPQPVSPADELPASQGEVPMPEPDGTAEANKIVHPGGGYEFDEMPAWSEKLVRAYGDARELAAVREPLTDKQLAYCMLEVTDPMIWGRLQNQGHTALRELARAIERAHGIGITAQAQQEGE